jgi:hypothetical protein
MKRLCTMCSANGGREEARYIASDVYGLTWYECPNHGPRDNVAETERTARVCIEDFLARIGLTLEDLEDLEEPVPPTQPSGFA